MDLPPDFEGDSMNHPHTPRRCEFVLVLSIHPFNGGSQLMNSESRIAKYLRARGWQYAYTHQQGCIRIVKWRSPEEGKLWSQQEAYNVERQGARTVRP